MLRRLEIESLEAEFAALQVLLSEAREINDPIGLIQYTQRCREIEEKISSLRDVEIQHASLVLYFGGAPVFGSRGIAVDFAGKALENFQEIVSKHYATTELGALGERGRVPLKDFTTLMVTGVTQGSFGFLLDELNDQTQMFDTTLKTMVGEVLRIIESVGSSNESVFEEVIETLAPRTLDALKNFFFELDTNAATMRVMDEVHEFSLDKEAVSRARVRTEETQIEENDTEIVGVLNGFLPDHRKFELATESGERIYGTATKESAEQYALKLQSGNPVAGKRCVAKIKTRTVKPLNHPSKLVYRLIEFISLG